MSYLRIAGTVSTVVLFAFLWWRVSLSFSQAETIDVQQQAIAGLNAARIRDTRVAREMAAFRAQQADFGAGFQQELAKKPLTFEVKHVDSATGATVVCRQRNPVRYRELFNSAVTGTPVGVP